MSLSAVALAATVSVGGLAGYGAEVGAVNGSFDTSYGVGIGARAGVAIPKLYFGLAFTHHLGTIESARGQGVEYESARRATLGGLEVGYEARLGAHFALRPYVGFGLLHHLRRSSVLGRAHDSSGTNFYLGSGLLAQLTFGACFVGLDARVIVHPILDPIRWAPAVFATSGYTF